MGDVQHSVLILITVHSRQEINGAVVASFFLFHVHSSVPNSLLLLRMIFSPFIFLSELAQKDLTALEKTEPGGSSFVVWFPSLLSDTLPFLVAAKTKGKRSLMLTNAANLPLP